MTTDVDTERLFSLACFEGLRVLRQYEEKHPHLQFADLIALIEKVDADGESLDLEASAHLGTLVDADCSLDGAVFYQTCIRTVLVVRQPLWAKAMRQGRLRFIDTLTDNERDIFVAAGLIEDPPPSVVVTWWDGITGHSRMVFDLDKMEQARVAERLSLDHEYDRLKKLGITKQPSWMGLDDNYAGYDILSYDPAGGGGLVNKMIEVKSTVASPLRYIVTRGEWDMAEKVGSAYTFHVWDMSQNPPVLHLRTVADVQPHIPTDKGKGKWTAVTIRVGN